jgi:uncharacterized protein (DUF885 family)
LHIYALIRHLQSINRITRNRNESRGKHGAATLALHVLVFVLLPVSSVHAQKASASVSLARLFHESDEVSLQHNPFAALSRGDLRYAARIGYNLSDEYFDAERAAARSDLKKLHRIPRTALSPTEQVEYDAFKWEREIALRALEPRYLDVTKVLPIESFTGFHLDYADIASGNGVATFSTIADYQNNLARHHEYVRYIDIVIQRLKEGATTGTLLPKLIVEKVVRQLDVQLIDGGDSIFNAPVHSFPDSIPESQRAALLQSYTNATRDILVPALKRLRDYLQADYLPHARASIGLSQMKGGAALYEFLIEQQTTLPLTAEALHTKGLTEVARIHDAMGDVQRRVGVSGTLHEFFDSIRINSALRAGGAADIQREFESIRQRVLVHLPEQFANPPHNPLEIRQEPSYKEEPRSSGASGYYQIGTADGTRPGIFFYNVGTTPEMDSVFLHEAIPGHHLQGCIAQNNRSLPAFLRYDGPSAYLEGWALYAETLWKELGVESDPYRRFGGLQEDLVRAMRLVVDTGIHAKGWSRDQAINYLLENSALGHVEAESAVDRYIATPAQALAYKAGELTILELKARALQQLNDKFDPRDFHEQVLATGALPLGVLREKLDRWLASRRAAQGDPR